MPAAKNCCFAWRRPGGRRTDLFDVQIAAGLVGFEYPAGYGSLMFKLLGQRLQKGETRTDWRRRPLSSQPDRIRAGRRAPSGRHGRQAAGAAGASWRAPAGWKPKWRPGKSTSRPRAPDERWWKVSGTRACRGAAWRRPRDVALARARGRKTRLSRRGACCATI